MLYKIFFALFSSKRSLELEHDSIFFKNKYFIFNPLKHQNVALCEFNDS